MRMTAGGSADEYSGADKLNCRDRSALRGRGRVWRGNFKEGNVRSVGSNAIYNGKIF